MNVQQRKEQVRFARTRRFLTGVVTVPTYLAAGAVTAASLAVAGVALGAAGVVEAVWDKTVNASFDIGEHVLTWKPSGTFMVVNRRLGEARQWSGSHAHNAWTAVCDYCRSATGNIKASWQAMTAYIASRLHRSVSWVKARFAPAPVLTMEAHTGLVHLPPAPIIEPDAPATVYEPHPDVEARIITTSPDMETRAEVVAPAYPADTAQMVIAPAFAGAALC